MELSFPRPDWFRSIKCCYLDITLFVLLHLDAWLIWTTVSGFRAVLSVTACGLLLCSSLWSFSLLSPSLSPSLSSFSQPMSSSALFSVFCCRMVWRLTWFDLHVFSLVSFYMCASNLVFRFDFECCSIEIYGPLCNFARSLTDTRDLNVALLKYMVLYAILLDH